MTRLLRSRSVRLLALQLVASCLTADAAGNLVSDPGFEQGDPAGWVAYGKDTVAEHHVEGVHQGKGCLRIDDAGAQIGQANTPFCAVSPWDVYVAEAWLRPASEPPVPARLDVQFFDTEKRFLEASLVGDAEGEGWTRLRACVFPPADAVWARLRVMPAWGGGSLHGTCLVDDVLLAPADGTDPGSQADRVIGKASNHDDAGVVGTPPLDLNERYRGLGATVGFEDLAGWELEFWGEGHAELVRSGEEFIEGSYAAKLRFRSPGDSSVAVLKLAAPVPVPEGSDTVDLWCHCDRRTAPRSSAPRVSLVLTQAGSMRVIGFGPAFWSFWSIAHRGLREPIGAGAELVAIRLSGLRTGDDETRTLFLDRLEFTRASTTALGLQVPAPRWDVTPDAVLPLAPAGCANRVAETRDGVLFASVSDEGRVEYRYTPRRGDLSDLVARWNEGPEWCPLAAGGPVFTGEDGEERPGDGSCRGELLSSGATGDALRVLWRYHTASGSTDVEWRLRVHGQSLVIDLSEKGRGGRVAEWQLGEPEARSTERVHVPYLTGHCGAGAVWLVDGDVFMFRHADWRVSHASAPGAESCEYTPLTDGRRLTLSERLVLTVSGDFQRVLPSIPNPPSGVADVLGKNVYVNLSGTLSGESLSRSLGLWREMKRLGMERLIVKHHAHTWSRHSGQGNEPFVQTLAAAVDIPGGDRGLVEYISSVRALGFDFFLYTDYCIVAPVNRHFDESLVSRRWDGSWRDGWYQYYALSPLLAPVLARRFAPGLKERYGLTGSYCDQHTAAPSSRWVDFDWRKPGAGMAQTVLRAYAEVFAAERESYGGPVVSEGGHYWKVAGLVDGNYAQLRTPAGQERWQMPFLVDFDLLRIHPLEVDVGMGWRGSYGYDDHARDADDALDRFLCATIAFGHSGILYSPSFPGTQAIDPADPLGRWERSVVRTYFMIQELASRYAMVPVSRISYWDGARLAGSSDAVRSGGFRRSQVAVEYANGLRVFANGSLDASWHVQADGEAFTLPPNGWLAVQGTDFAEYSALRKGHRVDYVRCPAYTFADGRGVMTDFGDVQAEHAVIVLHHRGGDRHEIATPMGR